MVNLPKALIKKYGISKKAWAVFRGRKLKVSSSKSKTKRYYSMAKKKKKTYRKSNKGILSKALNILMGAAVAGVYEVLISPRIPLSRNIKNILEMVIGLIVAAMPKLPMAVRAGGAALATINAFEIVVPLIAGMSSGKGTSYGSLGSFLQN